MALPPVVMAFKVSRTANFYCQVKLTVLLTFVPKKQAGRPAKISAPRGAEFNDTAFNKTHPTEAEATRHVLLPHGVTKLSRGRDTIIVLLSHGRDTLSLKIGDFFSLFYPLPFSLMIGHPHPTRPSRGIR